MSCFAGPDFYYIRGIARTAKELLELYPSQAGKDGYYFLYPSGIRSEGQLVYCDMTTDGGGWMLIARSHPTTVNYNSQNWGWRGGKIGNVKDFSQAYQAGWWTFWNSVGLTFASFIFGNRKNINNNEWGPFVYKNSSINYTNFTTSDTQQSASRSTIKSDVNVYGSSAYPGMQQAIGFPITGTNNNIYYLRDCCGFSSAYGGRPTNMGTTYCNSARYSSGPWCNGSSSDVDGDFVQGGTNYSGFIHGGTNQYMIMVK